MKPKNIKTLLLFSACIIAIITSSSIKAQQMAQSRNVPHAQISQLSESSDPNKQTMREIEMMRKMLRERKDQQDQQRQVLQDLQQTISGPETSSTTATPIRTTNTQPHSQGQDKDKYVTSGSTLSQIQTLEKLDKEQQKHSLELQMAQKEIELLKKQLTIANTQLDNCQRSSAQLTPTPSHSIFEDDFQQPQPKRQNKKQQQYRSSQFEPAVQQQAEPQTSIESTKAMQEIEMMRDMLRERRTQQDQQRKMILELQNSLN